MVHTAKPWPDDKLDAAAVQTFLDAAPFQKWLGVTLDALHDDGLTITIPWRDELISNPVLQTAHGGILASLVDFVGYYAVMVKTGQVASTADLAVDYHRPAVPGPLTARARILKLGRKISTARTEIFNAEGKLLASGRGAYLATGGEGGA